MRKIIYLFIGLLLFMGNVDLISAEMSEGDYHRYSKEILDQATNDYLISQEVGGIVELDLNQQVDLFEIISALKKQFQPTVYAITHAQAGTMDITGAVLGTLNSKTSGWAHGHLGIGVGSNGAVVESNLGSGVALYANRVNSYWRTTTSGGMYSVRGGTSAQNTTAANYARSKIGSKYSLIPSAGSFYCSELVWYSWNAAGINIDNNRAPGSLFLPLSIMNDVNTIEMIRWNGN